MDKAETYNLGVVSQVPPPETLIAEHYYVFGIYKTFENRSTTWILFWLHFTDGFYFVVCSSYCLYRLQNKRRIGRNYRAFDLWTYLPIHKRSALDYFLIFQFYTSTLILSDRWIRYCVFGYHTLRGWGRAVVIIYNNW